MKRRTLLQVGHAQIIDGLMLGDGHISPTSKLIVPSVEREYIEHLRLALPFEFGPIRTTPARESSIKGVPVNLRSSHILESRVDQSLTDLRARWYPNDKKTIPQDLQLSPLTVLHWFYGDGSTSFVRHGNYISVKMKIATMGFTWEECERLSSLLQKVDAGIDFTVHEQNKLPVLGAYKARTILSLYSYIWDVFECDCFKYKIKIPPVGKKTSTRIMSLVTEFLERIA